ncbi:MAG: hypothetical protein H8F28_25225 [Fibrella sp.]|nr:hypothetical protein [Armatimonadota bacterium]
MPYSDFVLPDVVERFGLTVVEEQGTFAQIPPLPAISDLLQTLLAEQIPLAQAINTEKARSEFIVANVLAEIRRQMPGQISLFSGVELSVSRLDGLSGYCDFLISLTPQQMFVRAPIVALVEAKNADMPAAWGQCLAEMLAAQRFNAEHENVIPKIYGAVTTGTGWMFGVLEGTTATIDYKNYSIDEPERICGIIVAMARQTA